MKINKNKNYIICLLDLTNGRQQDGIFVMSSQWPMSKLAFLFGASGKLKKALGLRWEIHISQLMAGRDKDKLPGISHNSFMEIYKAILAKLNNKTSSSVILLPANTPR